MLILLSNSGDKMKSLGMKLSAIFLLFISYSCSEQPNRREVVSHCHKIINKEAELENWNAILFSQRLGYVQNTLYQIADEGGESYKRLSHCLLKTSTYQEIERCFSLAGNALRTSGDI
jgi:hypothetical protein